MFFWLGRMGGLLGSDVWDRTGSQGGGGGWLGYLLYVGAWSAGREGIRRRVGGGGGCGCMVLREVLYITRICGFGCNERAGVGSAKQQYHTYLHGSSNIRFSKPPTAVPHAGWSRLMQQHLVAIWTRDDWCPGGGVCRGEKGWGRTWNFPWPIMPHSHANLTPTHWRGLGAGTYPVPCPSLCEVIQPRLRLPRNYFVVFRLTLCQLVLTLRRDHPSALRPSDEALRRSTGARRSCAGRREVTPPGLDEIVFGPGCCSDGNVAGLPCVNGTGGLAGKC